MASQKSKSWIAIISVGIMLLISILACVSTASTISEADEEATLQALMETQAAIAVAQTDIAIAQASTPESTPTSIPSIPPTPESPTAEPTPQVQPTAEGRKITFEGFSFWLNPAIAEDAVGQLIPADVDPGNGMCLSIPEYILFIFTGYTDLQTEFVPHIAIIPMQPLLEVNECAAGTMADIREIIAEQSLATSPMPYLAAPGAGQLFTAKRGIVDALDGQGIRYLNQHGQDIWPIHNIGLLYNYVGISANGDYYIAASFPISHPSLPNESDGSEITDWAAFDANWDNYIHGITTSLNGMLPDTFTPPLHKLDMTMYSILTP